MIYLDYNATAPLTPAVQQAMTAAMQVVGNPSSIHGAGRHARRIIESARQDLAQLMHCDPTFITFTSGATEANNTVLHHAPVARILVSAIEHPSVLDTALAMTTKDVALIPVTPAGVVDVDALDLLLRTDPRPTLISVMLVNNETGVIQPLPAIAALAKRYNALLHTDAVQALGKMPLHWPDIQADFVSLCAHKMGGPAGVGALIYNHDQPILKLLHGGGQERRRRAGTENLIGIAGFGAAVQAAATLAAPARHTMLEQALRAAQPQAIIFGQDAPRLGHVTQIALPGVPAEKQLMALDLAGFAVSSGSACSSGTIKPSHVLSAMGVPADIATCAIRISSGWATTDGELQQFADAWLAMAERLVVRPASF